MAKINLPPMKTLAVFEAVARHKSFQAAAQELFITNSAVSQNIKNLEEFLQQKLFSRNARHVDFTKEGEKYYLHIQDALGKIELATKQIKEPRQSNTVVLSVLPSMAMLWLIPKLPELKKLHPDINLQISNSCPVTNFSEHNIDMAIEYITEKIDDEKFVHQKLWDDYLILVASPYLKFKSKNLADIMTQQQCIFATNELRENDWPLWCKKNKVQIPKKQQRLNFDVTGQAIQATCNGLGVMVAHEVFVRYSLASNTLIQLDSLPVKTDGQYCLMRPKHLQVRPVLQKMWNWLLEEADCC